jgi:RPA family protein
MSDAEQGGAGRREVAYRVFAAEYDDADYSYSESDEERAPNYVITPTGARVNRLFVVGVLTEVEQVSDDVLRARVVDPTGAFVLYAGQYQPDEQAVLERLDPPAFVAVTGKARTFQPEDSDQVFTSIRPESINEVDTETRDRWTIQAAKQTIDRIGLMAAALDRPAEEREGWLDQQDIDDGLAAGIPLAIDHYGTTPTYLGALRETALDAVRVVADELDEVEPPNLSPDAPGDVRAADLARAAADISPGPVSDESASESEPAEIASEESSGSGSPSDAEPTASTDSAVSSETVAADAETTVPAESPTDSGSEASEPDEPVESAPETSPSAETATELSEPASAESETGPGDFDPDEFELEPETREQIEEEYGTEFQSGTEVDEPGSADIETPEPDEPEASESADAEEASQPDETDEMSPDPAESTDAEAAGEEESEEPSEAGDADTDEPEDMQEALLSVMRELDDGAGAEREALVAAMEERYGTSASAVEEEIQEALMDGQCYEPEDDTLKPI